MNSKENILIHSVKDRLWYVNDFIIPSLKEQSIENIIVYTDYNNDGNLKSFLNSIELLPNDGYTWHLQDDIVISSKFGNTISSITQPIACGFTSKFDRQKQSGDVNVDNMWFSFPCIKIPNDILKEFSKWCNIDTITDRRLKHYIRENKNDDTLFKKFIKLNYPDIRVLNIEPNIVNHVDYLLGGSISNPKRLQQIGKVMSKLWNEDELIKDLEYRIYTYYNSIKEV